MSSIGVRLREERDRLDMNQTDFAEAVGATRKTQFNYESDQRRPDADFLAAAAAIGVDVMYVLTGKHGPAPQAPTLTSEERLLLDYFRDASKDVKRATLGALLGAATPGGAIKQVFKNAVGDVAGRDVIKGGRKQ